MFINSSIKVNSKDSVEKILSEGSKIIFIRHSYAPGSGDPDNFDLLDCSTQRNLNEVGIAQAIKLGNFFLKNNIKIDKVLSSEWCRCKETAMYAFKKFETKNFLNSFFSQKFAYKKVEQIKELKDYIENWDKKENLILVTHFVVISEILNLSVSSGEIVIINKDFNILGQFMIK
ncbi:histidine phosphatase family protein [Candidatus Pelagibacter sp. Uisw_136]|uniref:histidine phosphatase family protein n=1 Tax=Candidatus Pelagibacter sp. Uisw_136 TaxID=3230991 RepID=UPI0039ED3709